MPTCNERPVRVVRRLDVACVQAQKTPWQACQGVGGIGFLKSSVGLLRRKAGFQCSRVACPNSAPTQKPPNPQIRGFKRQAAAVSSATTCAIVLCSGNTQLSPAGTSRAAIAASTCRQAPWAGKPITASRTRAQAPQVLQVASEYVAGQTAIRLPAGVYRGKDAVRSRHSPIVSAHSSRRLLNRCRTARRA